MSDEKTNTREPIEVKFSLPQIIGGALAAATAATIGSQLGVAGTIVGAAVASVVGGIAGTLYSAGLDRTHRKVTEAIQRGYERVRDQDDVETQLLPAVREDDTAALTAETATPTAAGGGRDGRHDTAILPAVGGGTHGRPGPVPDHSRRNKVLVSMGISVAAIFVVAMLVVTAVELGLGRSLDGSSTTTIGGARRPVPTASASPSATKSTSASASATPSATPTSESPTPEPSATPSATESPEPTPSATPADLATPAVATPAAATAS